jgi:hypothetical protein
MSAETVGLKCLTCDLPCLLLELSGCDLEECPHLAAPATCGWFARCPNPADKDVEHPTLGSVPCCDEHIAWLGPNPSPTQFVPPMVALRIASVERVYGTDR